MFSRTFLAPHVQSAGARVRAWLSDLRQGLVSRGAVRGAELGFVRASDPELHFHTAAHASEMVRAYLRDAVHRAQKTDGDLKSTLKQVRSSLAAATLATSLGKPDPESTEAALTLLDQLEGQPDLRSLRPSVQRLRLLLNDELPAEPFRFSIPRPGRSPRLLASLMASSILHARESLDRGATEEGTDFLRAALLHLPSDLEHHRDAVQTLLIQIRGHSRADSELLGVLARLEKRLHLP